MKKVLLVCTLVSILLGVNGIEVRSNLGARGLVSSPTESVTYTAADYVQDGLVAMWDGIENAGLGIHDDNSPIWVDLVGENHLTMVDTAVWEANCSLQANTKSPTAYRENAKIAWTFAEVVCDWSMFAGTSETSMLFSMGNHVSDDCPNVYGNWAAWYNSGRTKYFVQFHTTGRPVWFAEIESLVSDNRALRGTLSIDKTNVSIWRNSIFLEMQSMNTAYLYNAQNIIIIGSNHMNGERGFKGRFYNVRIYNRVLSQEEIEHNYIIDKARFRL